MHHDPGLELLAHLRQALSIEDARCRPMPRGLTWWPHRLAVRLSADEPIEERGTEVVRVRAETVVLRDLSRAPAPLAEHLDALNREALAFGLRARDDGSIACESQVVVHAGNLPWAQKVFTSIVALQAALAHERVESWATALGGVPAWSEPSSGGARPEPDEMLSIIDAFYRPRAGAPLEAGEAFEAMATMFCANGSLATASERGLTVEFALGTDGATALVMLEAAADARLGHGLRLTLRLAPDDGLEPTPDVAQALQRAAWQTWSGAADFGGWHVCPRFGTIAHTTFVPAVLCDSPPLLVNLVMAEALRGRWASALDSEPG